MGVDSIHLPIGKISISRWIKEINWFGILIATILLFLMAYTLGESDWVRVPPPLFFVTILAVINGWLLSKTRWWMAWGAVYSFLMALSFGRYSFTTGLKLRTGKSFCFWNGQTTGCNPFKTKRLFMMKGSGPWF